jgi:hypothetical protein
MFSAFSGLLDLVETLSFWINTTATLRFFARDDDDISGVVALIETWGGLGGCNSLNIAFAVDSGFNIFIWV